MIFIIGKKILLSFLALIFIPLVVMAFFSGTIINREMEQYASNNLEDNLKSIKLVYKNSFKELESILSLKANDISIKNRNQKNIWNNSEFQSSVKKFSKENHIDIIAILDKKDIKNFKNIEPVLQNSTKKITSSTEIIPENFIKSYNKNNLQKYVIRQNNEEKPILASIAQISACPIENTEKILVGIRFLSENTKLWQEITELIEGRILFIQNNYIVSEIIRDQANEKSLIGSKISNDIYNQINNHKIFTSSINLSNKNYISIIEPLSNHNKIPIGAIFLAVSQNDFNNFKKQNTILISLTILAVGIIVSLAAYITSQRLIKSIDQITVVTRAVKRGDLSKRVNLKEKNEIALLGANINKMIESLQDRENQIKEYQKEIQDQKENLEAIFNSLIDGVITISNDCRIIKVNPTVALWIGLNESEIIGKKLTDFIKCRCTVNCIENPEKISKTCPLITQNERLMPTEARITSQHYLRMLDSDPETDIKNLNYKQDRSLGLSSSPVSGIEGEPTYVIVLRDITEFKEMDKIRDDFIATLTHDLRVPILAEANTIKFFLKELFGPLTDKQIEAMENMLDSNSDLLRLVNSLLDTYRYESGRSELYKEPAHIKKLVQDCIAELTPLAKKNDQILNNLISKEIPVLNIDKNEIKRVVRNLINNAISYSPKGGTITLDAEHINREIIVKVIDTGKGIPESEQELIFDRFFTKAKKFRKIGTGLGLYLSRQIIEKHNGKIWVESKLGEGSTFFFSLPLDKI